MSVSLTKGQKISLEKTAGKTLTQVVMGLGWDAKKAKGFLGKLLGGGGEIDLDASCVMFGENRDVIDTVWFSQLKSRDGSILHTGDNRTGEGDGDDEQIIVDLTKVSPNVKTLVFTVSSFTGQNFSQIENAFCRLVDKSTNAEIAKYILTGSGTHTASVMATLTRNGADWELKAVGQASNGRTFDSMMPDILPNLS